jgi:hypothetical protein
MMRSLTDTSGGYHLGTLKFPWPLPTLPFRVLHFTLFALPDHTNNMNINL